jgi:hypothetical protein
VLQRLRLQGACCACALHSNRVPVCLPLEWSRRPAGHACASATLSSTRINHDTGKTADASAPVPIPCASRDSSLLSPRAERRPATACCLCKCLFCTSFELLVDMVAVRDDLEAQRDAWAEAAIDAAEESEGDEGEDEDADYEAGDEGGEEVSCAPLDARLPGPKRITLHPGTHSSSRHERLPTASPLITPPCSRQGGAVGEDDDEEDDDEEDDGDEDGDDEVEPGVELIVVSTTYHPPCNSSSARTCCP